MVMQVSTLGAVVLASSAAAGSAVYKVSIHMLSIRHHMLSIWYHMLSVRCGVKCNSLKFCVMVWIGMVR